MDFVEGLPKFEGFDTILVTVDRITKFSHFITFAHPFTATYVSVLKIGLGAYEVLGDR